MLKTRIDPGSYIPFYVQVKDALQAHIEQQGWRPGEQLPSEPELCEMFDVSRTVIRQALQEMEREGFITRRKGKGTFVAEPKIHEMLANKLTGFYHDMIARGLTPVTRVLKQEIVPASDRIAAHLNLAVGEPVVEIERLRFVGDEPLVLVKSYLPYALCPELADADLTLQSLYDFLEHTCNLTIAHGKRTIEAVSANEYEAHLLQVDLGAALVQLDSITCLEDETPIEYYRAFHRGDRTRFEVELVRV